MGLFSEHYGARDKEETADIVDPASDAFWERWNARARRNTELYRELLAAEPDDQIHSVR